MKKEKPDCYECKHCQDIPGNCHKQCSNKNAKVEGHEVGINGGWFMHPYNFDPTWLKECDGFEKS